MAKNIIYYGPPGTGKTFYLQKEMSNYKDYTISDQQVISTYTGNSKIWILLSMIILQNLGKMNSNDIQRKCDDLFPGSHINANAELEKHNINTSIPGIKKEHPYIFIEYENGYWYLDRIRLQQAEPAFFDKYLCESKVDNRYAFVTFHQSFSYEDFVEGIRPEYDTLTKSIDYSPKPGVFKKLCHQANSHPEKEYAIFIDEINRGNISEIFGELISLIEIDKRKGSANELTITLPYSKETFYVPNNVNIIGSMNSSDRSIGFIDMALRRRFTFIPMMPDAEVIDNVLRMNNLNPNYVDGIDVIKLFLSINSRIELLLDENHTIGHSFFLSIKTGNDIVSIIRDCIIPLLEDFFFNDLQKIQLVFNDLDSSGELKDNPIYMHRTIPVEENLEYVGDYLLDDKKHYFVNPKICIDSLKHIY